MAANASVSQKFVNLIILKKIAKNDEFLQESFNKELLVNLERKEKDNKLKISAYSNFFFVLLKISQEKLPRTTPRRTSFA